MSPTAEQVILNSDADLSRVKLLLNKGGCPGDQVGSWDDPKLTCGPIS